MTVVERWTWRWRAYKRMETQQHPIKLTVWRYVHAPLYFEDHR